MVSWFPLKCRVPGVMRGWMAQWWSCLEISKSSDIFTCICTNISKHRNIYCTFVRHIFCFSSCYILLFSNSYISLLQSAFQTSSLVQVYLLVIMKSCENLNPRVKHTYTCIYQQKHPLWFNLVFFERWLTLIFHSWQL